MRLDVAGEQMLQRIYGENNLRGWRIEEIANNSWKSAPEHSRVRGRRLGGSNPVK